MSTTAFLFVIWAALGAGALVGWSLGFRLGYTAAVADTQETVDKTGGK